jgi:hypothetical protein
MGIITQVYKQAYFFFNTSARICVLPGLLADGALSLRGQRGEHDDDAVVARRALDKVPELVAVEPDDGALERELAQLLHLLCEAAAAPALLLPAHISQTTMFNRILYDTLSFIYFGPRHLHFFSQCCGSGTFIPDHDFYPSWIPDPKTATKERGVKKICCHTFF